MLKKTQYTLYPIMYKNLYDAYTNQLRAFWTPYELDFSQDVHDLDKMKPEEREMILKILAFFANSDNLVLECLTTQFSQETEIAEAKAFYGIQAGIEVVHAETYALMIDSFVKNEEEKIKLFEAIENYEFIKKKFDWCKKVLDQRNKSLAEKLLAFALVEGVFFSSSFAVIYWIKEQGKMKGLSSANDLISRDENLHKDFSSRMYNELNKIYKKIKSNEFWLSMNLNSKDVPDAEIGKIMRDNEYYKGLTKDPFSPMTQETVDRIVKEAVEMEKEFVKDVIPKRFLGLNSDMMSEYVEYVSNIVAESFGFEKVFKNAKQPFDFMIKNDIRGKVNFFEQRPTEYKKAVREDVNFESVEEEF